MESETKSNLRVETLEDGALWRIVLTGGKKNILDLELTASLTSIFEEAQGAKDLKAVLIDSEGPNFSYGASVEEHLPGAVEKMLPRFHAMFHAMLDSSVWIGMVVRGHCLGGGLEFASFAHRIFAGPDAKLGQPEITLGVFPPFASIWLLERVGRTRAEDLCLTGRTVDAPEALQIGLIDDLDPDPNEKAMAYLREFILPRSGAALRHAIAAIRAYVPALLGRDLERVERFYLGDLMATHDAEEGLRAFLEKRPVEWSNT